MRKDILLEDAIARIQYMEKCLEVVQTGDYDSEKLRELARYMESGQWLLDYELDEAGLLPGDLKRGVLAQDTLYDLLEEHHG